MRPARKRAKAIAKGRGRDHRVVIPLAFGVAARISARPLEEFRNDPTQLANGLGELHHAINADGIVCALAYGMELASADDGGLNVERIIAQGPVAASLEACRRLDQTVGDDAALLAGLTGPATLAKQFGVDITVAAEAFGSLVKHFCDAGIDVILVLEEPDVMTDDIWVDGLKTANNVAKFHEASLLLWESEQFPTPFKLPFDTPAAEGIGFITTDAVVPMDADIEALRDWVAKTKGK